MLKLSNNNQHNMTTSVNKNNFNNNESEDKSSINMNNIGNKTLKNIPSSSIFNCTKSDKNIIKNLNSNIDLRKYSSSSFYNEKTNDNYTKTNSINNITNKTNFNNGYGIWNLKHGANINLNNMRFNNKYYGVNQSYDFHYNSLGLQNMKYYNNPFKIKNNNTQIFSNFNQVDNNDILSQININNELKSNQFENNYNFHQNNYINVPPPPSHNNYYFSK